MSIEISVLAKCDLSKNIFSPRKIRYALPAYLITWKRTIDLAIIKERPSAARRVCIKLPVAIPNAEMMPAFFPLPMLLVKMTILSFPGVKFNKIPVNKNVSK